MPSTGLTSAGIAIGTPAYMAPEQLAGDAAANHRIDIYAVGLLAYELVTGVSPFTGPSPRETLAAQLTRDPKPLHEVSPEIPRSLSALIMRCLAKDPDARPQTRRRSPARARLDDDAARRHAACRAASARQRSGKPWMSVAAVAILLAVLVGVGYGVTRSKSPTTNVGREARAAGSTSARTGRTAGGESREARRRGEWRRAGEAAQARDLARGFRANRRSDSETDRRPPSFAIPSRRPSSPKRRSAR